MLQKIHVHYILLTNGGGKTEAERISQLSEKLGVRLSEKQIVQSHTPFRVFATGEEGQVRSRLEQSLQGGTIGPEDTVLVVGGPGDKARHVARGYGFKDVLMSYDLIMAQPSLWPFTDTKDGSLARRSSEDVKGTPRVRAIFVFNDPRDWALDIQVIIDLLLSDKGIVGTRREGPNAQGEWQDPEQPALFFGCDDLFWANDYPHNRLGQGAFRKALEGIWREITGQPLTCTVIGKPHSTTYAYAEGILSHWRDGNILGPREELRTVYMVGDNPESDIRGANEYRSDAGTKWESILVRSGVYRGGEPKYKPSVTVADVEEGVRWALEREGIKV